MGCGSSVEPTAEVTETGPSSCPLSVTSAADQLAPMEQTAADEPVVPAVSCAVRQRPAAASGTFLRVLSVNDVYKITNYPMLATAIKHNRAASADLDCKFISCTPLLACPPIHCACHGQPRVRSLALVSK